MNKKFTIVICNPTEPIGLGQKVYGGVVSAAYDRELSDAHPAVAVNEVLPSLPEPALQGNTGECCGNHTTGGEYMGQSESICCGQFEEYVPDYYTAEQMREYARAAIEAAEAAEAAKGGL